MHRHRRGGVRPSRISCNLEFCDAVASLGVRSPPLQRLSLLEFAILPSRSATSCGRTSDDASWPGEGDGHRAAHQVANAVRRFGSTADKLENAGMKVTRFRREGCLATSGAAFEFDGAQSTGALHLDLHHDAEAGVMFPAYDARSVLCPPSHRSPDLVAQASCGHLCSAQFISSSPACPFLTFDPPSQRIVHPASHRGKADLVHCR